MDPQPVETESSAAPLGSNLTGAAVGHTWVNSKVFSYLSERELLSATGISSDARKQLVIYGGHFADEQWLGRPEAPTVGVWNHLTAAYDSTKGMLPRCTGDMQSCSATRATLSSQEQNADTNNCVGLDILARASMYWTSDRQNARPSVVPWFEVFLQVDGWWIPAQNKTETFAMDNVLHYGYADLADIDASANKSLVMYPSYGDQVGMDCVAGWLHNLTVLTGVEYGVAKHGAILYQMARRFFDNSLGYSEPKLGELQRAGNAIAGWSTGGTNAAPRYANIHASFPSTYLGGMPFICAGSSSKDTCSDGRPTWPIWVPATYSASNKDAFLAELERRQPGRSDNAALIYLGWAAHMLQDAAMPHHAANWTGPEHAAQDDIGRIVAKATTVKKCSDGRIVATDELKATVDTMKQNKEVSDKLQTAWLFADTCSSYTLVSVDDYMKEDLNAILGPASAPKSIDEICSSASIDDNQIATDDLGWQGVYPLYRDTLRDAYHQALAEDGGRGTLNDGFQAVRRGLEGTIKLFLCASPRHLSPALMNVLAS
jgi:hypothetical protein